jgi:murein DD-endopeptidase MepM/ murein hydrolase activator NlpD
MSWRWPLWAGPAELPDEPGRFGAIRKHDVHTGVDLYTYPGMSVLAVEPGVVVGIEKFTGPKAGSPWWNDTQAILVEGESGVVCYGELTVEKGLKIGSPIEFEQYLGGVKAVLRQDKGRPRTMLHFELYTHGTRESVWWRLGEPKPENLLDPTARLEKALAAFKGASC